MSRSLLLAFAISLAVALPGCSQKQPEQTVYFADGILNMAISDQWVLQRDAGAKAFYRLGSSDDVKLTFENETSDLGQPLNVAAVKSMIGSELNMRYGQVNARIGLGGSAVLAYSRKFQDGDEKVYAHSWVVARPYGAGAVARVAITLRVPDGQQGSPEFQALVENLDRQVGDAKMPDA